MLYAEIGSWDSGLRIRTSAGFLEKVKGGRAKIWYSEGELSLIIEDGLGEDNPIAEVPLTAELLKSALSILEIDRTSHGLLNEENA